LANMSFWNRKLVLPGKHPPAPVEAGSSGGCPLAVGAVSMLLLRKRTEPSHIPAFTPPVWPLETLRRRQGSRPGISPGICEVVPPSPQQAVPRLPRNFVFGLQTAMKRFAPPVWAD
jgi:hypothetical protein